MYHEMYIKDIGENVLVHISKKNVQIIDMDNSFIIIILYKPKGTQVICIYNSIL